MAHVRRSSEQLIDHEDPAWPLVQGRIAEAKHPVEILSPSETVGASGTSDRVSRAFALAWGDRMRRVVVLAMIGASACAGCGGRAIDPGAAPGLGGGLGSFGGSGAGGASGGSGGASGDLPPGLGKSCALTSDCDRRATCDVATGTCVLPCRTYPDMGPTVPCSAGQVCAVTAPRASSRCYDSCSAGDPASCRPGFVCQRDTYAGASVCLRAGTAAPDAACQASSVSTGCANWGYLCTGGVCRRSCDPLAADPGCPAPQVCGASICADDTGDPAAIDAPCAANAASGATPPLCASDGKALRGQCSSGGVCGRRCDQPGGCPAGQYCDLFSACTWGCDFWATNPGCPAGLLCDAAQQSCVAPRTADPAAIGALCTKATSTGCGSDGKVIRGLCNAAGAVAVCAARCRTDADCPATQHCRDALLCV